MSDGRSRLTVGQVRWKLAAWMGETLWPQGGKCKLSGWAALDRVRQGVMVHGVRQESLAKRGTWRGT